MGKRGPKRSDLKLRLLYNLLASGRSAPMAVEFSGLNRQTAYNYIDYLVQQRALRKIGKSPATYEPMPDGLQYKAVIGQNSKNFGQNFLQTPHAGGRATASHDNPVGTTPSASQSEDDDKAAFKAKSGPGTEPEPGQSSEAGQEAQDGAKAGPGEPPQAQSATAGQAGPGARAGPQDDEDGPDADHAPNGLPLLEENPEIVRPAPPVPLDQPARVHHRAVRLAIVRTASCHPIPDPLQWGPPKPGSHGEDWYKQAEVQFDGIGIVTLQEFNTSIRLWLPEQTVHDRKALEEAVMRDLDRDAQRVANWLQRHYGYRLGLPEPDELHVAFPLPAIGGTFKGWLKIKLDDGTTITIDKSKEYVELEFLVRAAQRSQDLHKILNWASAPTLLTALQEELYSLEQRLPAIMKGLAVEATTEALPALAEAIADKVEKKLAPKIEVTVQAAMGDRQYQAPPPGPGDNVGYG